MRSRPLPALLIAAIAALGSLAWTGAPAQQPTFRAGVEVILIDVIVVDRDSQPVDDLRAEDFLVLVDRKPRKVVSAQFLDHGASPTAPPVTPRRPGSQPSPPAAPARTVVIAVDEDSLDPADGLLVRQAATRFLNRLTPADRVGVATLPRLRPSIDLTTNRRDTERSLGTIIAGHDSDPWEFTIGLAEAFAIARKDILTLKEVADRECAQAVDSRCRDRVQAEAAAKVLLAQTHGQRSVEALHDLARSLQAVPGPKMVVLVTGGMTMPESLFAFEQLEKAMADGQITLYSLYVERSPVSAVKARSSPTEFEDHLLERDGVENATARAGGRVFHAVGNPEVEFDRVATELSGSYLIGIEVEPADRDGRTHDVQVRVQRPGAEVRARRRYLIEPPRPVSEKPRGARPTLDERLAPEAQTIIDRAGRYVVAYDADASAIVAEEHYTQRSYVQRPVPTVQSGRGGRGATASPQRLEWELDAERTLRSDYLLVKAPGVERWMPFRDVYEVNRKQVRERQARLQALFLDGAASATERAAAIMAESVRHNIGFIERNVNVPVLALRFLQPAYRERVAFRQEGEKSVAGIRTWQFAFAEHGSPTIVQSSTADLQATGTFWVEPATGRVVRSTLRLNLDKAEAEITVTYGRHEKAGETWVPVEMREDYRAATTRLECVASYTNIRRFKVATDVRGPEDRR